MTLSGTGVGTAVGGGLILNAVYSRKLHTGNVTPLDIVIDRTKTITQQVTVEPRTISSGHVIVFQFNQAIMQTGTATAVDGSSTPVGTVSSVIAQGNEVRVSLTNIPDGKRATVSLNNVNGSGNAQVSIGFLLGDVTNSHMVSAADIAATKARSGQAIDVNNAKYDINLNGAINSQDVSVVKSRAGQSLP